MTSSLTFSFAEIKVICSIYFEEMDNLQRGYKVLPQRYLHVLALATLLANLEPKY